MDTEFTATVDASGRAKITIKPDGLRPWIVSQVSTEMPTAPVSAVCTLRKGGRFISYLIPTGDAAGGDPPVETTQSRPLTVEFTGCTPGDQATAFVIYEESR